MDRSAPAPAPMKLPVKIPASTAIFGRVGGTCVGEEKSFGLVGLVGLDWIGLIGHFIHIFQVFFQVYHTTNYLIDV